MNREMTIPTTEYNHNQNEMALYTFQVTDESIVTECDLVQRIKETCTEYVKTKFGTTQGFSPYHWGDIESMPLDVCIQHGFILINKKIILNPQVKWGMDLLL